MLKKPIERAREDEREGKALSTQAGEFVREEIDLIREKAHGARSTKQAIAIGLSKARRSSLVLPGMGTIQGRPCSGEVYVLRALLMFHRGSP